MAELETLNPGGVAVIRAITPFVVGCASGMVATACVQPIDTVKVRMQLADRSLAIASPWGVAKDMVTQGGLVNLYQGLSAALLRQVVYGTMRLGLFSTFEQRLERKARGEQRDITFGERTIAGLGAGALAALIGNPTEVVLIRMQADGLKSPDQQQRYKSAFDATRRIYKSEGITALWKGAAPTVIRAMSTNFGQLTFFSEAKHQLQKHTELSPHARAALAAAIAGCTGALMSQPFDFIKTRLQNQTQTIQGNQKPLYRGTVDCLVKSIRHEGFFRLYRDILPYFMRVGPHSTIALVLTDRINEHIRSKRNKTY